MDLWVFDNDGTLYDDLGASEQFLKIFYQYFAQLLSLQPHQVARKVSKLKRKWSTEFSILALVKEYGVDFTEAVKNTYLKINLETCNIAILDPIRLGVLNSLRGKKIVFTNNPSAFARYVLARIGLLDCFSDLIGMEETGFFGKPNSRSYQAVEVRHPGFEKIIFCDDSLKNLNEARRHGWVTVWCKPVNMSGEPGEGHIVISSFKELKSVNVGSGR